MLHLARPEQAVGEVFRVLVPGGRVALTVWDVPERTRLFGVFLDAVAEAGAEPSAEIPVGPPFFRFSDDQEFIRLLNEQQLENVDVRTIAFSRCVSSTDELWRAGLAGTVRTSALIESQTDEMQWQIRAAFQQVVQPYHVHEQLHLPVAVKLASATKPTPSR